MMSLSRSLFATGICAMCAGYAAAQAVPAVQADVEITYVFQDGREVRVLGRYYRSSDGRVREDSGSGTVIADTKGGTMTLLNAERKQALVLEMPDVALGERPKPAQTRAPYARGTHEGRPIDKTWVTASEGNRHEVWTAPDLAATVFSRIESAGLTTTKVLRNLRGQEPSSHVFEIPDDYVVTRQTLPPEPNAIPTPTRPPARPQRE